MIRDFVIELTYKLVIRMQRVPILVTTAHENMFPRGVYMYISLFVCVIYM